MAEIDDERSKKIAKVIARAWADDEYKKKLKTEPEATLRRAGIKVPSGVKVKVHENTGKVFHWVLPAKPAGVAKKDLESAAARKRLHIDACCSG